MLAFVLSRRATMRQYRWRRKNTDIIPLPMKRRSGWAFRVSVPLESLALFMRFGFSLESEMSQKFRTSARSLHCFPFLSFFRLSVRVRRRIRVQICRPLCPRHSPLFIHSQMRVRRKGHEVLRGEYLSRNGRYWDFNHFPSSDLMDEGFR